MIFLGGSKTHHSFNYYSRLDIVGEAEELLGDPFLVLEADDIFEVGVAESWPLF